MDLDSSSEDSEDDDVPKTWHRSPLHFRRGRRPGPGERTGRKASPPAGDAGDLWKRAADRPTTRLREHAEKRRRFLQQRCQMHGWDLTGDQERHSVVVGHAEDRTVSAAADDQSQEDLRFVDQTSNDGSTAENVAATSPAVEDRIRQIETSRSITTETSVSVNTPAKESSSFENIYDMVSLEPDRSSDELVQFFEPHPARVDAAAVYGHSKPSVSNRLPPAGDIHPAAQPESCKPDVRNLNISNPAGVTDTSVGFITSRPSSAPSKPTEKTRLDAKSIVEQEKLNFIEYKIDYRRQQSSGNESGSGRSDVEKDLRRQPGAIPPDDYEYILRKIHYNRPTTNKADQVPTARTKQGSELHIEIKKPSQTVTRHIAVDVAKPSVPHRVESLQHSGLHHQFHAARPDVIPSPNYEPSSPSMIASDVSHGGKYSNRPLRTVLHSNHPSVSTEPSASPGNTVFEWESRVRTPLDSWNRSQQSQYIRATSTNSEKTEPGRKPPKQPREEFLRNRSPDFWNYNSTYEPGSPSPQSHSVSNNKQETWQTCKGQFKDAEKPSDQDLVRGLVRGLDGNSALAPEAAAVFREQYRWSIHEPSRSVEPDQLKHSQPSELPCSRVFASSICVPSKPVQLVGQVGQPSSKGSGAVRSHREKVFSVTGYHRPQQQKNPRPNDSWMYPSYSDVRDSCNNDAVKQPEPLYWYSEADKRKPIISSPAMETALSRDCREGYSYQRSGDQDLMLEHSGMRQGGEVVDTGWKRGLRYRDDRAVMPRDARLQGQQKSQDRLVQQMSLGSQELAGGHLHSNSSHRAAGFPVSSPPRNIRHLSQSDHVETGKSSGSFGGPSTEVNQQPSHHLVSRASADYEKHVLRGQENYRSQVMARIKPPSSSAGYTAQDGNSAGKGCRNVAVSSFASPDVSKGYSAGRKDSSEVGATKPDADIPSPGFMHKAQDKKCTDTSLTNREKRETCADDDDPCLVSVAEIKAKLFGPDEDGARKLFRQQGDAVKWSRAGRNGDGKLDDPVRYSAGARNKRSDELSEFETLVERLNKDKGDDGSKQCSSTTDVSAVKRLSATNITMLLDSSSVSGRGKQSPSLEYAKDWLTNERRASAPVNAKWSEMAADGAVPPADNAGRFVSHRGMQSLPNTESSDLCRPPVGARYISSSSSSAGEVRVSQSDGTWTSGPPAGSVVLRPRPSSSAHGNFARRSLPALTEKDAERWQNMVARIQEKESRNEAAKSRSVERLASSRSPEGVPRPAAILGSQELAGGHVHSNSCHRSAGFPVSVPPRNIHYRAKSDHVESRKSSGSSGMPADIAASAQPLFHTSPDVARPADPVKPRRQQTPREVKSRSDDCRARAVLRGLSTNTDSGYLDSSGSDSHGSSEGTDVLPRRQLRSESNESDEVELQRYACDDEDDDDDVKLLSGTELCLANTGSAPASADRSNGWNVSTSEYVNVSTESRESRTRQLQKLREDCFGKQQSHSSSSLLLDKSDMLTTGTAKSDILSKDVGYDELGDSSQLERSVGRLGVGLPKEKSAKPLYVSPLVQTSCHGIYRSPLSVASRDGDDRSTGTATTTVGSAQLPGASKISSFKMVLPSHENTDGRDKSKVTHIPVMAVAGQSGQSRRSAFVPYLDHRDSQIPRTGSGGRANVSETRKESMRVQPAQFEASRLLERTVEQPSLRTFQRQSELFRHERQELKEPRALITRQVTDSKVERTYRVESHAAPWIAGNDLVDKCEPSDDGEMTDATDVTLDLMVGANQTPAVDAVDFSDVEFLSSANLPAKYNTGFTTAGAKLRLSHPPADVRRLGPDVATVDAAAKTEMKLHGKNRNDLKADETEPAPVERRRSIKELVHSFEDMMTPFMRARPRSLEIRLSSSSSSSEEESNQYDDVDAVGRKRKKVTLRASSSFKEATRLDRKSRQPSSSVNH